MSSDSGDVAVVTAAPDSLLAAAIAAADLTVWEWNLADDTAQAVGGASMPLAHGLGATSHALPVLLAAIHPADRARVTDELQRTIAGGDRFVIEFRVGEGDSVRWLRGQGRVERDATGQARRLVGIGQDVTAERTTAEALRLAEERLRLAQQGAALGAWEWYPSTGATGWTDAAYALFGIDPSEPKPWDRWWSLIAADDQALARAAIEQCFASGRLDVEYRYHHPTRGLRWIGTRAAMMAGADGVPRMAGVSFDDTERRDTEAALRQSEERFRALAELAPAIVWTAAPDGTITYASDQWFRYCGVEPEANARRWPELVLHPDDRDRCMAAWQAALRDGTPYEIEVRNRRHDGVYRWFLTRAVPRRDAQGAILEWFGTTTDIDERKRGEEALANSEATLRAFYDHAPVLMGVVELTDDGDIRHLYDNAATAAFFGLPSGDTGGRSSRAFGTPEPVLAEWRRHYEASARAGAPVRFDYLDERASGVRWLDVTVAPLAMAAVRPRFCYVASDITERRAHEAAARDGERFRQRVAEVLPSVVYVFDLDQRENIFVNATLGAALGHGEAAIAQQQLQYADGLIHPDDQEQARAHLARVTTLADGETATCEYRLRHADDSWRWFLSRDAVFRRDDAGRVRQIIGTATDITERRQAEEALARLNEAERAARQTAEGVAARVRRLHALANALGTALTRDAVARAAVEQAMATFGASAAGLNLVTEDQRAVVLAHAIGYPPAVVEAWQRVSLHHATPFGVVVATGEPRFWATRAALLAEFPDLGRVALSGNEAAALLPLRVGDRVLGVLALSYARSRATSEDERAFATAFAQQCAQALDRATVYESEQRARLAAEAAERVKDEFLSVAAHELKTPLTVLQGYTYLLSRRVTSFPDAWSARAVEAMSQETERLARLVNNLLDSSRRARGRLALELTTFPLDALVREVAGRLQGLTTHHQLAVAVAPTAATAPLLVRADRERIDQVLVNLISNAIVYSPAGGPIAITLDRAHAAVMVVVQDEGIGIPAARQAGLFEQFYRAHADENRDRQGMGVGLYLSRELARAHGGDIQFTSAEGAGSTFWLSLPLAPPPT